MRFLLVLILSHISLFAITRTVCPGGSCDHLTVAAAVTAASDNDVIRITPATYVGDVTIQKHLRFESSLLSALPGPGQRVNRADHEALMPRIQGDVTVGYTRVFSTLNGVNITTNSITFESQSAPHDLAVGAIVACWAAPSYTAGMPGGMPAGNYIVATWVSRVATFTTLAGTAVDLTTVGASGEGSASYRPYCTRIGGFRVEFEGIRFARQGSYFQLGVGDRAQIDVDRANSVKVRHSIFGGDSTVMWDVSGGGAYLGDCHDCEISDSDLRYIFANGANGEPKAIGILNSKRVLIRNNYISSSGIGLLTGGDDIPSQLPDMDIEVSQNYFEKPGFMWYRSSPNNPAGACKNGSLARNTTTPSCFICSGGALSDGDGGSWGSAVSASLCPATSANFNTKNLLEFKSCLRCLVEGNYFNGQPQTEQAGQGFGIGCSMIITAGLAGAGSEVSGLCKDVIFRNNLINDVRAGMIIGHSSYNGATFSAPPLRNVAMQNTAFTKVGNNWPEACADGPYLTDDSGMIPIECTSDPTLTPFVSPFRMMNRTAGITIAESIEGLTLERVTISGLPLQGLTFVYGNGITASINGLNIKNSYFGSHNSRITVDERNNGRYDASRGENPLDTTVLCGSNWLALGTNQRFDNTRFFFPTGGNATTRFDAVDCNSIASNVTYSSADPLFTSDIDVTPLGGSPLLGAATDGGAVGADMPIIKQFTDAAKIGGPTAKTKMALRITPLVASVRFDFGSDLTDCVATVWTNRNRTTISASQTGTTPLTVSASAGERWVSFVCGSNSWIDSVNVR